MFDKLNIKNFLWTNKITNKYEVLGKSALVLHNCLTMSENLDIAVSKEDYIVLNVKYRSRAKEIVHNECLDIISNFGVVHVYCRNTMYTSVERDGIKCPSLKRLYESNLSIGTKDSKDILRIIKNKVIEGKSIEGIRRVVKLDI